MSQSVGHVVGLRVDHLRAPIALARQTPRFTWQTVDAHAGDVQVAYRITISVISYGAQVRDQPVATSGRVLSPDSVWVEVPGFVPDRGSDYRWTVEVWLWSNPEAIEAESNFGIAEIRWDAPWVEPRQEPVVTEGPVAIPEVFGGWTSPATLADRLHPPRHIRQRFLLRDTPTRARLRITSQGIHRSSLNGTLVSEDQFEPGYESYQHEISVVTHDVGALLQAGENVLGVIVADGWYAGRISILGRSAQYGDLLRATWELDVRYADGSELRVVPDDSVRSSRGPIDWSDIFIGERYDARQEIPGWDRPGFDDSGWDPAALVSVDIPLHPYIGEPVRRVLELPVRDVLTSPTGDVILDFGQVIAGRVGMRVRGDAGVTVRLEHTETLDPQGNYFINIVGANKEQTDEYVLSGDPAGEQWEPAFTFHGFRYVRVTGYPTHVVRENFTAVVLSNDLEQTADLHTSDPRLNQLVSNTRWSQRGNFLALPTDCPQRERAGWTGDVQIFAATAATLMNVAGFLERWLRNVRTDQRAWGGIVPEIVPLPPAVAVANEPTPVRASAGWSDVIAIAPWVLYCHYGDDRFLSDNFEAMLTWVGVQSDQAREFLPPRLRDVELSPDQRERQELLWNGVPNFGDWLAPSTMFDSAENVLEALNRAPELTSELTGPAFQLMSLEHVARAAAVLGNDDLASKYRDQAGRVEAAFTTEYVREDGWIAPDMQGVYVLAVASGLVPETHRPLLAEQLVRLIRQNDDHLDTGFASVAYLLDALWDNGHAEVARSLLFQDTVPSWLYEVRMGATTIWESWDAVAEDGTVQPTSLNHYAFGCVVDWMMRRIAGITLLAPAYRVVGVQPDLNGSLTTCAAHIDTPYGRLSVDWQRSDEKAEVLVTVPIGVEARFEAPAGWSHDDGTGVFGSGSHLIHLGR
jgi:alpha-L-rhamnosidase